MDPSAELLEALVRETAEPGSWRTGADSSAARAILEAPPSIAASTLSLGLSRWGEHPASTRIVLKLLTARTLRRRGDERLRTADLMPLVDEAARSIFPLPLDALVGALERALDADPGEDEAREAIAALRARLAPESSSYMRGLAARLDRLLAQGSRSPLERIAAEVRMLERDEQERWLAILDHARTLERSPPRVAWIDHARALASAIDDPPARTRLASWIESLAEKTTSPSPMPRADAQQSTGLVWIASFIDDPTLVRAIGRLAEACLRKVVGYGPVSARVGHAAIRALASSTRSGAVSELSLLKERARYRVARRLIDRALLEAAERSGSSVEDIEEAAVPTFGLTAGTLSRDVGGHTAALAIDDSGRVSLTWRGTASVPAEILRQHRAELDALRRSARDIRRMLTIERHRLDHVLSFERVRPIIAWRERYLDHPLVSNVARRLIWELIDRRTMVPVIFDPARGTLIDIEGAEPTVDLSATVRLWHPVRSDRSIVDRWRAWIDAHGIAQPFLQAHRPVFEPSDDELLETSTGRFKGRVLFQHQLGAVARHRGWGYTLAGAGFETESRTRVTFELRPLDLIAELEVSAVEDIRRTSSAGAWFLVATGDLSFGTIEGGALRIGEVPSLVFSEVAREVSALIEASLIATAPSREAELPGVGPA
jgi:hypothetical protein